MMLLGGIGLLTLRLFAFSLARCGFKVQRRESKIGLAYLTIGIRDSDGERGTIDVRWMLLEVGLGEGKVFFLEPLTASRAYEIRVRRVDHECSLRRVGVGDNSPVGGEKMKKNQDRAGVANLAGGEQIKIIVESESRAVIFDPIWAAAVAGRLI